MPEIAAKKITPFLRWAGGKKWLIPELVRFIPEEFGDYHEPFLGGGSIFIHLKSNGLIKHKAYLSDLNEDLINAYKVVKNESAALLRKLDEHRNEKEYYYSIRTKKYKSAVSRASQFIFLNRTSYNGIYRVNLNGKYNVPFGDKSYQVLFEKKNLKELTRLFQEAIFTAQDFNASLVNIKKGDLVFLDPPYTVQHEHNGFVKYNQKIFSWKDQESLKSFIDNLNDIGAKFVLTNAAHQSIEKLYKEVGKQYRISRYSVIGGTNAQRGSFNELIFYNT